jgi:hypothetical protein
MKASFAVAVPLALALDLVGAIASMASAQADPRVGSWKLNLEKSKFNPGEAPKSDIRTYVAEGDGVRRLEVARDSMEPFGCGMWRADSRKGLSSEVTTVRYVVWCSVRMDTLLPRRRRMDR